MSISKCPKCGKENDFSLSNVCPECGIDITDYIDSEQSEIQNEEEMKTVEESTDSNDNDLPEGFISGEKTNKQKSLYSDTTPENKVEESIHSEYYVGKKSDSINNSSKTAKKSKNKFTLSHLMLILGVLSMPLLCAFGIGFFIAIPVFLISLGLLIRKTDEKAPAIIGMACSAISILIICLLIGIPIGACIKEEKIYDNINACIYAGDYDSAYEAVLNAKIPENEKREYYYKIYVGQKNYDKAASLWMTDFENARCKLDISEEDLNKVKSIYYFLDDSNQEKYDDLIKEREEELAKRQEEERIAAEQAAKEQAEREAAEKAAAEQAAKEQAEREAAEKAAAEQAAIEQAEREAAEKAAAEQAAKEQAERELAEKAAAEQAAKDLVTKEDEYKNRYGLQTSSGIDYSIYKAEKYINATEKDLIKKLDFTENKDGLYPSAESSIFTITDGKVSQIILNLGDQYSLYGIHAGDKFDKVAKSKMMDKYILKSQEGDFYYDYWCKEEGYISLCVNDEGNISYISWSSEHDMDKTMADSFVGEWSCDRCIINIDYTDCFNIEIIWGGGVKESQIWTLSGVLDEYGNLNYIGSEYTYYYNDKGDFQSKKEISSNESGYFTYDYSSKTLSWHDNTDNDAVGMKFIKNTQTTQDDSSSSNDIVSNVVNHFLTKTEYINFVKNGTNSSYPGVTYGEAFDDFFAKPKWKYFKSTDDKDVVEFTGKCMYRDVEVEARIQFVLYVEEGTFEMGYVAYNEVPQSAIISSCLLSAVFESYYEENGGAPAWD